MAKIGDPRELFLHKLGATYTMEQTVVGMLEKNAAEARIRRSNRSSRTTWTRLTAR